MRYITAFFMAWGNFCSIPCPCRRWEQDLKQLMLVFFPLVGLLIGLLWCGLFWLACALGLPVPLSAALLTAWPFAASGFIHLDGFMDVSDAVLSRRPLPERRRILKDPHVGSFAVISVCLLFLFCFAGFWSLLGAMAQDGAAAQDKTLVLLSLSLIPVVSRCCCADAVLHYKPMETSQYSGLDRENNGRLLLAVRLIQAAAAALCFGVLLYLGNRPFFGITGLLAACAGAYVAAAWGRRQLAGMNGDIAGFALTVAELTGLLWLTLQVWK